jgi:hypothetical protein
LSECEIEGLGDALVEVDDDAEIWLTCYRTGNGVGDLTFYDADIGALKVSSIS